MPGDHKPYLGQRDQATAAGTSVAGVERERDGARGVAQACSEAVEGLESAAAQRHDQAEPARAAAAAQVLVLNQRADYTLSTAPAGPGDACASVQALGSAWLKGRPSHDARRLLLCLLALGGCATAPRVEIQTVKVPVPVACREPTPDRPSMPTESLAEDADPFDLLRASLAEIDRREGYEVKLVAALENCKRPRTAGE